MTHRRNLNCRTKVLQVAVAAINRINEFEGDQGGLIRFQVVQDSAGKFNAIQNSQCNGIISWSVEHQGIRILDEKSLEQNVLPRYYQHNRIASFVRQLNMYGFHKKYLPGGASIFCHSDFDPLKKRSLLIVRRKISQPRQSVISPPPQLAPQIGSSFQRIDSATKIKRDKEPKPHKYAAQCESSALPSLEGASSFNKIAPPQVSVIPLIKSSSFVPFTLPPPPRAVENAETILEELAVKLMRYTKDKARFKEQIRFLKTNPTYRSFLCSLKRLSELYARLGLEMDMYHEPASQLSVEIGLEQIARSKEQKSQRTVGSQVQESSGPLRRSSRRVGSYFLRQSINSLSPKEYAKMLDSLSLNQLCYSSEMDHEGPQSRKQGSM